MKAEDQNQCHRKLDTIMFVGNYLEALGMLNEEQLRSICSPYVFEEAARLIRGAEADVYGVILDEDSDEEQEKELNKTPEQIAGEAGEWALRQKQSAAFQSMMEMVTSDPDLAVQIGRAFEKDPDRLRAFLVAEDAAKPVPEA